MLDNQTVEFGSGNASSLPSIRLKAALYPVKCMNFSFPDNSNKKSGDVDELKKTVGTATLEYCLKGFPFGVYAEHSLNSRQEAKLKVEFCRYQLRAKFTSVIHTSILRADLRK